MPAIVLCHRPLASPLPLLLLLLLALGPLCTIGLPSLSGSAAPRKHYQHRLKSKPLIADNPFWHHFASVATTTPTTTTTTTTIAPPTVAGHWWASDAVGLKKPNKLRIEGLSDAIGKLQDLTVEDVKLRNQFAHRWLFDFLYKLQTDFKVHLNARNMAFIRRLKTACVENSLVTILNLGDTRSMNNFTKYLSTELAEEFVILVRAAILEENYTSMKDELKTSWKSWSESKHLYVNYTNTVKEILVEDDNSTLASTIKVLLNAAKQHRLRAAIVTLGKLPVLEVLDNLNEANGAHLLDVTQKILEAEQLEDLRISGVDPNHRHII